METIAIIGGGFSGTMTAVNLARLAARQLRVCLINSGRPAGRGVAYGTRRPEHLLNVAARNMSAFPDHPNHFLDWLRTRSEYADLPDVVLREVFVPRRVYGDYLRALSLAYSAPVDARTPVQIEPVEDTAVDVAHGPGGAAVVLASGKTIAAARVVLATGNQPPAPVPTPDSPFRHPAYFDNPWADWDGRLTDSGRDAILIGTGLTMVDAFLTLSEAGWRGTVRAVSRNGLLPLSHFRGIEYPDFPPPEPERLGLAGLVDLMERHCGRLRQLGANPAICVDKLRPHTQRIWRNFSEAEKRQFCTRYAARWNVMRHRVAEPIHARLMEAVSSGRLRVHKGRVAALEDAGAGVRVTVEGEGGERTTLDGGLVVNCTGPQTGFSAGTDPLFKSLLGRGLVRADGLDMGIEVDADFAAVGRDGRRSGVLYALGPLLRGSLWETTAVPELRGQAMRVAQLLLRDVHPAPVPPAALTPTSADVIEYCI
ncbi:MAG TPA: FAD/NAD(P)-binding protein [Urbifossiella sp.]|nr:FAD/NAD(P)-binding protein [Urbifossiella sp.]